MGDKKGKKIGPVAKFGLLVGAAFGALTSFQVWPEAFPTADLLAPMQWVGDQFSGDPGQPAPTWVPWLVRGVATLFFGLFGFALGMVRKLWWLIFLLAVLFAGGWFLKN